KSGETTRTGQVEGLGPASMISAAFAKPAGTVLNPVPIAAAVAVVKVVERIDADPAGLTSQKDMLREQLKGKKAAEREKLFEAGLVDTLTREGTIKIHKDVINRLESAYRSS